MSCRLRLFSRFSNRSLAVAARLQEEATSCGIVALKEAYSLTSSIRIMSVSLKYVAELEHVREVSLLGTADLVFWKDRLQKEKMVPAESDGKAQLLVIAADAKFRGIRFKELSFSVLVSQHGDGIRQAGAYLARAYNSCRFFAFCERVFFSTPYHYGDVQLSASSLSSIRLGRDEKVIFRAEMQADPSLPRREPSRSGEDGWEGPVFLPEKRRGENREGHAFFAKVRGYTRTYPFLPSRDVVTIEPTPECEIFQALIDSHFAGKEWAVREDATHAKSKTYKRSDVVAALVRG